MTWSEYNDKSQALAYHAEEAARLGNQQRSHYLYLQAANWEEKALKALPEGEKPRTLSITVVSVVSLYYKGHDWKYAQHLAKQWIDSLAVLPWAKDELREILKTIDSTGTKK